MCLQYKSFENTVGKGEIARKKWFLPFLQCFLLHGFENFLPFSSNLELSSANFFILEESKICCLGKAYEQFSDDYSLWKVLSLCLCIVCLENVTESLLLLEHSSMLLLPPCLELVLLGKGHLSKSYPVDYRRGKTKYGNAAVLLK